MERLLLAYKAESLKRRPMQDVFTILSGNSSAKAKPLIKNLKESSVDEKIAIKDFLSIMLAQIKESMQVSKEQSKISLEPDSLVQHSTNIDLIIKGEKKSFDNHLLEDLLKIISLLKNPDGKTPYFPSLSNKFTKLINSETAFKELKNINNITELLALSKKYSLGLERISVKNIDIEALKKEFPLLAKKEFFTLPKIVASKDEKALLGAKNESILFEKLETKPAVLHIGSIEKLKIQTKNEPTLFEKIISSSKEEKKETTGVVTEIIRDKITQEKSENISTKTIEESKKTIKIAQDEAPKVAVKLEQNEIKTTVVKEALYIKTDGEVNISEVVKSSEVKMSEVVKSSEVKMSEVARLGEARIENSILKKGLIESMLQGIKADRQTSTSNANLAQTTESSEAKAELVSNRIDIKPQIKLDSLSLKSVVPTRETLNSFATDLRERVENYKPPIMKLQLALNPKGLGEVDVMILNRGNNLYVNISSNLNTMLLFTQNQAEFKNSLVNMGFTNLEMNFSNQKENKEHQHNSQTSAEHSKAYDDEDLDKEMTSIELIVPRYV